MVSHGTWKVDRRIGELCLGHFRSFEQLLELFSTESLSVHVRWEGLDEAKDLAGRVNLQGGEKKLGKRPLSTLIRRVRAGRCVSVYTHRQTDTQTDRQTERQRDRQTDAQTHTHHRLP